MNADLKLFKKLLNDLLKASKRANEPITYCDSPAEFERAIKMEELAKDRLLRFATQKLCQNPDDDAGFHIGAFGGWVKND